MRARNIPSICRTVAVLCFGFSGSLSAQEDADFATIVDQTARHWNEGRSDSLALLVDPSGLRVTLPRGDLGVLDRRQAMAALSSFFESRTGQGMVVKERRIVGAAPATAYAELSWDAMQRSISELQRYTVFLGYTHPPGDQWRLTELRVLR